MWFAEVRNTEIEHLILKKSSSASLHYYLYIRSLYGDYRNLFTIFYHTNNHLICKLNPAIRSMQSLTKYARSKKKEGSQ